MVQPPNRTLYRARVNHGIDSIIFMIVNTQNSAQSVFIIITDSLTVWINKFNYRNTTSPHPHGKTAGKHHRNHIIIKN